MNVVFPFSVEQMCCEVNDKRIELRLGPRPVEIFWSKKHPTSEGRLGQKALPEKFANLKLFRLDWSAPEPWWHGKNGLVCVKYVVIYTHLLAQSALV